MWELVRKPVFVILCGAVLSACTTTGTAPTATSMPTVPAIETAAPANATAYLLGSGDELRVIVYGEEDLSGEFRIGGEGAVSLPLIGSVGAAGLSIREFESQIAIALQDGYLLDPRVSVEVLNFRPFYIIGEVENGGEYPYTHGMSVLNAVAVAGGYTYRANRRRVFITRAAGVEEIEVTANRVESVRPGDIIRVPERFF